MNTFIFLGCVPVPEWQHKIDFVTKTVLDKENTYILVRKKYIYTPPSKDATWGFWSKKSGSPLGGGVCCTWRTVLQCGLGDLV